MKIINFISILLIPISCTSQNLSEKYILDDVGIYVEKPNSTKQYDEIYNSDNKVYKIGKTFTFSYYYENLEGKKFLISKGEEIKKGNYIEKWDIFDKFPESYFTEKSLIYVQKK